MGFLIDPRMWDDPWFRRLSLPAQGLWQLCLLSRIRTALPGLVANASEGILADTWGQPIEVVRAGIQELLLPDNLRKQHFFWDSEARVIRIPNAPKYQKADNPNMLAGWYKNWRDVPDCKLKWDHLESLRLGVNLNQDSMHSAWSDLFAPIVQAYDRGVMLTSYAELPTARRDRHKSRNPDLKGDLKGDRDLDLDLDLKDTVTQTVSKRLQVVKITPEPQNRKNPASRSQNHSTTGRKNLGGSGGATDSTSLRATDDPEVLEKNGWKKTKGGTWMPPGYI